VAAFSRRHADSKKIIEAWRLESAATTTVRGSVFSRLLDIVDRQ
jgi:hypothetical protein